MSISSVKLAASIFLAFIFWALLFGPFKTLFWLGMTSATLILGAISIRSGYVKIQKSEFTFSNVMTGLISSIVLYLVFWTGDRTIRFLFPHLVSGIQAVYGLKSGQNPFLLMTLLFFIIGPMEEIFWRGYIQSALVDRSGAWRGVMVSALFYTGVHFPAQNPILLIAAAVCGIYWGILLLWRKSLIPPLISHAIWDVMIFVLWPLTSG